MVESEESAIIERWEPPRRMCYDLLYVYLILIFVIGILQIVNQMMGDFLRGYALILTIGILIFMLIFSLYYAKTNPPIRPSEVRKSN